MNCHPSLRKGTRNLFSGAKGTPCQTALSGLWRAEPLDSAQERVGRNPSPPAFFLQGSVLYRAIFRWTSRPKDVPARRPESRRFRIFASLAAASRRAEMSLHFA